MRRLLGIVCILFVLGSYGTNAQGGCSIELENTILQMIQAQRAADSGNPLTAVALLQSVKGDINRVTQGCDTIRLTETYTNSMETIRFKYPEGWQVNALDGNFYLISSDPNLMDVFEGDVPETLEEGQAAIALQVEIVGDDSFDEQVQDTLDDIRDQFVLQGDLIERNVRGRTIVSVGVKLNDALSGHLNIIDYTDKELPAAILILGITNTETYPIIRTYTDGLGDSVLYPPTASLREIGVSALSLSYDTIDDLLDMNENIRQVTYLSPTGTQIAYTFKDQLCVMSLEDRDSDCYTTPSILESAIHKLYWSPDERYIAFHQNFLQLFLESDVWVFNTEDHSFTNLTDDGTDDFGLDGITAETWLEVSLTWGADNQIYVVRQTLEPDQNLQDGLHQIVRVNPDDETSEVLLDLTDSLPFGNLFESAYYVLDGALTVSPDASQMAVAVNSNRFDEPLTGVWLLDLTGNDAPRQIASIRDLQQGIHPDVVEELNYYIIQDVAWNADGTGVFVLSTSAEMPQFATTINHIDLETGTVAPFNDIVDLTPDDMIESTDESLPSAYYVPRIATLSPDYTGIIILHGDPDIPVLSYIPFEGVAFGEPQELYRLPDRTMARTILMERNGNLQIDHYILFND